MNVVDLLAILVGNSVALGRARIGAEHNAAVKDHAHDRRARLFRARYVHAAASEHGIAAALDERRSDEQEDPGARASWWRAYRREFSKENPPSSSAPRRSAIALLACIGT
jgi:hypothetical protein